MIEFQQELKALLEKYNATIVWTHEGGNCGIEEERMIVTDGDGKTLVTVYNGCIRASDL